MTEKLRETLMPLYKELINSVSGFNYYKAFFCVQWNFPIQRNCSILFAGVQQMDGPVVVEYIETPIWKK